MREVSQIKRILDRVVCEVGDVLDLSGEKSQIVGVKDALTWVVDEDLPEDWLDGYFREN